MILSLGITLFKVNNVGQSAPCLCVVHSLSSGTIARLPHEFLSSHRLVNWLNLRRCVETWLVFDVPNDPWLRNEPHLLDWLIKLIVKVRPNDQLVIGQLTWFGLLAAVMLVSTGLLFDLWFWRDHRSLGYFVLRDRNHTFQKFQVNWRSTLNHFFDLLALINRVKIVVARCTPLITGWGHQTAELVTSRHVA